MPRDGKLHEQPDRLPASPDRLKTPVRLDIGLRLHMQYDLFELHFGYRPENDEDILRWQEGGEKSYAARFTALLTDDPDIVALAAEYEKDQSDRAVVLQRIKDKMCEKLFGDK